MENPHLIAKSDNVASFASYTSIASVTEDGYRHSYSKSSSTYTVHRSLFCRRGFLHFGCQSTLRHGCYERCVSRLLPCMCCSLARQLAGPPSCCRDVYAYCWLHFKLERRRIWSRHCLEIRERLRPNGGSSTLTLCCARTKSYLLGREGKDGLLFGYTLWRL